MPETLPSKKQEIKRTEKFHMRMQASTKHHTPLCLVILERIQRFGITLSITTRKLPPGPVPAAKHIHHHPSNRARHRRPSSPHAIFECSVQVEESEGDNIRHAGLGESLLSPCFERRCGSRGFWRVGRRGAWKGCERGDRRYLVVKVVCKRFSECIHDGNELGTVE